MQLEIGKIYTGKVKAITQYGAFVDVDGGGSGMVHISEIANTFVNEIRDHLTEGQEVKVKVIGVNEAGKVSLSIKKAVPRPNTGRPAGRGPAPAGRGPAPAGRKPAGEPQTAQSSFEDRLSRFKASSDERMGDIKRNMDSKRRGSRRK